jgi:rhamnose transport system ATP-binding protein
MSTLPEPVLGEQNQVLLELRAIHKSFGAVRALRGVSFDLRAGEVHALLGENGAGKSTLIKVITGAHAPDSGSIVVGGSEYSGLDPAQARAVGIVCIYQQPALFPDLSVAENIGLRLRAHGPWERLDWRKLYTDAAALLERVGAQIPPDREVRALSMPEQQLLEIACAIGSGARIVIMDEPTASLTHREQALLHGVVRELRTAGVGVIYISHRLEEVFALADRVTVLRDGESVGTRRAAEVTEAELIRWMVGREMAGVFPERSKRVGPEILSVRGLECRALGVSKVTFTLAAGEVLGFAGLVGAGRTELARVLFGLTEPDAGEVTLRGLSFRPRSPQDAIRQGLAYVPEDRRRHGVVLPMAICENVTMAAQPRLFPGGWIRFGREREVAAARMDALRVKASGPSAPGGALSGGNQQKIAFARWLETAPSVLILDEPTQGVDVGAKAEIYRIIRELAESGMAVLMISSDLPEVIGMADRIAVMRAGTIVAMLPGGSTPETVMAAALGQSGKESA